MDNDTWSYERGWYQPALVQPDVDVDSCVLGYARLRFVEVAALWRVALLVDEQLRDWSHKAAHVELNTYRHLRSSLLGKEHPVGLQMMELDWQQFQAGDVQLAKALQARVVGARASMIVRALENGPAGYADMRITELDELGAFWYTLHVLGRERKVHMVRMTRRAVNVVWGQIMTQLRKYPSVATRVGR